MRRSQNVNQTWSFHISGNDNSNNLWPELCQMNQVKYSVRKKEVTDIGESNRITNLDDSEYPELSSTTVNNKNSVALKKQCLPKPTIEVLSPTQLNMEPKKSKRFKRTDKICINLQEALQDTRCTNKINNKALPKFRINIYKGTPGVTASNIVDRNMISNLKKVRVCISKDKRPSKLKRIILLNRNLRAQINMRKREAFEHKKMQAICKDIDTINFNALKITDPEIDVDYVKRMCRLTLYGKDYESRNTESIPESSVHHRPDVIKKMNNLRIQGKRVSNRLVENSNTQNPYQFVHDIIENDIVKHTLSLKIKEDIKQEIKQEIKQDIKQEPMSTIASDAKIFLIHSRNFRE